jgi:hypothetical protein
MRVAALPNAPLPTWTMLPSFFSRNCEKNAARSSGR